MCLALPAQIMAIEAASQEATVALANIRKRISIALIEDPQIGDFVLVHVGYALHKISAEEAERTLQLMSEADLLDEGFAGDLLEETTPAKIARPA